MHVSLKGFIYLSIGLFTISVLLAITGIVPLPWAQYQVMFRRQGFSSDLGLLGFLFVVALIFAPPSRKEWVALILSGALTFAVMFKIQPFMGNPRLALANWTGVIGLGMGLASLVALLLRVRAVGNAHGKVALNIVGGIAAIVFLGLPIVTFLNLNMALLPVTLDPLAYHFDATFGFQASVTVALLAQAWPAFDRTIRFAYDLMPYAFAALYTLQVTRTKHAPIDFLAVWIVGAVVGVLLYFLCPVSGPLYLFGNQFPAYLPSLDTIPVEPTLMPAVYRNGVPSLHFGWALLVWMHSGLLGLKRMRSIFALFAGITFLATLGTGEHYFVDLVIAVPYAIAVLGICAGTVPIVHKQRWMAIVIGLGLVLAWIAALRWGVGLFQLVPGLSWAAVFLTIGTSIVLYRRLFAAILQSSLSCPTTEDPGIVRTVPTGARVIWAMFFVSGFAGLLYEVLFSKVLALTFGSMSTATYTVLATYMGGMAIGSWLGGKLATRRPETLFLYAACELGIGLYCLTTPYLFMGIQQLYLTMAANISPDSGVLTLFRMALGICALFIPTMLMGMTLPILARFFQQRFESLGRSVAFLYGANTMGAATGALLAGYAVIPFLGVHKTTLLATMMNFLVAFAAIRLRKKLSKEKLEFANRDTEEVVVATNASIRESRLGRLALLVLAIGGIVTLAIEIKYIHLLSVVSGNSTYAFSLMLFTFLLGLGGGSSVARRLLKYAWPLAMVLAWLEFALAIVLLGTVFLWSQMPDYFASFALYPLARDFASREFVRGLVCWIAMFPPAFFIGAIYPVAMECVGRANPQRAIQALGVAAALNTAGNIVGVLLGGFVLLPYLGALRSVQLLAVVSLALGILALMHAERRQKVWSWAPAIGGLVLLLIQPASLDYTKLASGANVYFMPQGFGHVIDHAESIDGGLTSVAVTEIPGQTRILTLLTNGKFQGNNAMVGEMQAQVGFALAPLLHTSLRDRALVIGYGTGVSSRTLEASGFKELDIVDLSADILRMADKHFENVNDRVRSKSGVRTYVTDGRNFLMLQNRKYDLIGIEISSIWFAGAASLYNQEFYKLAKRRLSDKGVLQQWVQLHHMRDTDILNVIGSIRSEFRYVWLYIIGGQGILIATNDSNSQPDEGNALTMKLNEKLVPLIKTAGGDLKKILDSKILDPASIDRMLGDFGADRSYWVSTDDNLSLEYSTPKGNVLNAVRSYNDNLNFLRSYASQK